MDLWQLSDVDLPGGSRNPKVLESEEGVARAVLISLDPGQELGDHQVREHAWILVVSGSVTVQADGETHLAGAGALAHFQPGERHAVAAPDGARLLVLLAPWPAESHYHPGEEPTRGPDRG